MKKQGYSVRSGEHFCTWNPGRGNSDYLQNRARTTAVIYRLDVQAALKRGLYFVIIVDSFFLIHSAKVLPPSSYILHHSARFLRPSARFVLPSARFLIPDSYLPPPYIAQGALRRALCYISCLPPPDPALSASLLFPSVCLLLPSAYPLAACAWLLAHSTGILPPSAPAKS